MPAAKKTSTRKDPSPRPINAGSPYFELTNPEPERRYVWVYKAAQEHGVDYYEGLGYEVVQYREGGVKNRLGKALKPGAYVESRGHVLMQTTAERAKEIYEFGDDGQSGQAGADAIERRMFQTKKAIADLARRAELRSREGNQYFSFEAEAGSIAAIPNGDD
jgi:hypothetical protein